MNYVTDAVVLLLIIDCWSSVLKLHQCTPWTVKIFSFLRPALPGENNKL